MASFSSNWAWSVIDAIHCLDKALIIGPECCMDIIQSGRFLGAWTWTDNFMPAFVHGSWNP
eukprot:1404997-Amphidinium_carterae.1